MATFQASGLASGMDTASIIDQLVALESRPLTQLRARQSGLKTQLSALGEIVSKLNALASAARDLEANGVLSAKAVTTNDAFTATPGSSAAAGRYSIEVLALARAAKFRSAAFASGEVMAGGTLQLTVQGKAYDPIVIADGKSLEDVAFAIRQSGAPVSAVVLDDGTSRYLSITSRDTGYPIAGAPGDALAVGFTPAGGATGKLPAFAQTQPAENASVLVDDLPFTRQSNTFSDAVPGTTLVLKKAGAAEDLVLSTDPDATKARLQKFVDAYNDVAKLVQKQLSPAKDTDRASTLAGDSSIRSLQAKLQQIVATSVPGLANVRSLADVGVKTGRDGTLTIDATTLGKALDRDPSAVNALFATATIGLGGVVDALVTAQTRAADGLLTVRQQGIDASVKSLDGRAEALTRRIESFRVTLTRQFAAMEETVSGLRSIGNFLSAQSASSSR
jgi:flagellar hook-associated protein 2